MASKARLRVGDVFVIRLNGERVCFGQVVGTYLRDAYYFALFRSAHNLKDLPAPDVGVNDELVLLALSLDAKIASGDWIKVGHNEVDSASVPLPAYKEGVSPPGTYEIVDYSGTKRRPAKEAETTSIPSRKVVAPVRLEKAIRAFHGLEPWLDAYDELRVPPKVAQSSHLFR